MANQTEQTFYKIIGPKFYFRDICPYNIDVLHIPYGFEISSPYITDDSFEESEDQLSLNPEYIHFSEGAFHTAMWLTWLFNKRHIQFNQIYALEPIGPIVQAQCPDKAKLYQCGANTIRILDKVDEKTIFYMAVQEFKKNRQSFINQYPHIKFQPLIKAWERGQKASLDFKKPGYCIGN